MLSENHIVLAFINNAAGRRAGVRVCDPQTGKFENLSSKAVLGKRFWNLHITDDGKLEPNLCLVRDFPVLTLAKGFIGSLFDQKAEFVGENAGGWVLGEHLDHRLRVISVKGQIKNVTMQTAIDFHVKHKFANAVVNKKGDLVGKKCAFDTLQEEDVNAAIAKEEQQRIYDVQREYNRFIVGDKLLELVSGNEYVGKRDAFEKLDKWAKGLAYDRKIGALYGLRRTGKTIILHQLARKYLNQGVKVAYATYNYKDCSFNLVLKAVERLVSEGYRLILLDEVTRTANFYDNSMELADRVKAKVVIAGTDSLMLMWAMESPLFGRTVLGRTTGMRFSEYRRLFEGASVARFITEGGVLWGEYDESVDVESYLKTSVVENITHSLNMLSEWHNLPDKDVLEGVTSDTLYRILVAICNSGIRHTLLKRVSKDWGEGVSYKFSEARVKTGGEEDDELVRTVKAGIKDYYVPWPEGDFDPEVVGSVVTRLVKLNFLTEVSESTAGGAIKKTLAITQPYIKQDFIRRNMSVVNELKITGIENVTDRMKSLANGVMIEDIVFFEAVSRYANTPSTEDNVFKCRESDGSEIDVCVLRDNGRLDLIEVKYNDIKTKFADNPRDGQDKHFVKEAFIAGIIKAYNASAVTKTVLYRGKTDAAPDKNGVRWVNVEEWLLGEVEI